jgi:hypothetical protein
MSLLQEVLRSLQCGAWECSANSIEPVPSRSGREEKLFNPAGAVALYESPPPGEAPPTYPSPASK